MARFWGDQVHSLEPRIKAKYNTGKYILDRGAAEIVSKACKSNGSRSEACEDLLIQSYDNHCHLRCR